MKCAKTNRNIYVNFSINLFINSITTSGHYVKENDIINSAVYANEVFKFVAKDCICMHSFNFFWGWGQWIEGRDKLEVFGCRVSSRVYD
jgi:hypothetical protein